MRQAQRHYSVREYLILEKMSNVRHEYFDGEMFAMSGGSANHNRITRNLANALDTAVDRGCEAFVNDMRVTMPSGLFTYPDVLVVRGPIVAADIDPLSVTNPVVIAEVLSKWTRDYDRGQKFDLYRSITMLRDYLLVDQYVLDIEHRFLADGTWQSRRYTHREDAIQLTDIDLTLRVEALYGRVDFSASAENE